MSDNKPEKEFLDEKEDNKKGESLVLELDDSLQDEESNFSPASPVYELNSWREEPDTPKYIPESPLPDDFEPEPEIEEDFNHFILPKHFSIIGKSKSCF